MNYIEKILAMHSGKKEVKPGEIINVKLDYIMSNDATTTLAIDIFKNQLQCEEVTDPEKLVVVMDHYTPSTSIEAANTHMKMRNFAKEQGIDFVYDCKGVCHQIMMEKHVNPGNLVIGADSHTCTYGAIGALSTGMGSTDIAIAWSEGEVWMKVPETIRFIVEGKWHSGVYSKDLILKIIKDITVSGATYKAMQFEGSAIESLSISGRTTICNMAIEAGAKFAYISPDRKTDEFLSENGRGDYVKIVPDEEANYIKTYKYNVNELSPQIAYPSSVGNVMDIKKFEGLKVDEIFLGACTNGRLEDIEIAANILKGKKVSKNTRFIVTPASNDVYINAIKAGYIEILVEAGGIISTPGCSACFGGSIGVVGKKERLLSTANRNFVGRVGASDSEIYLGSPAVIAASAISGKITDPRRILI
ncbi:MAG: 3-isopropylmalate dehydratase large subunit [Clostridiales bacterium]